MLILILNLIKKIDRFIIDSNEGYNLFGPSIPAEPNNLKSSLKMELDYLKGIFTSNIYLNHIKNGYTDINYNRNRNVSFYCSYKYDNNDNSKLELKKKNIPLKEETLRVRTNWLYERYLKYFYFLNNIEENIISVLIMKRQILLIILN